MVRLCGGAHSLVRSATPSYAPHVEAPVTPDDDAGPGAGGDPALALALQHSLLPPSVPSTDELEVVVRYRAGADGVRGDLYDVVPLGAGRVALVVGDVPGRGVRAAAVMGQLRAAVRTCARLGLRPGEAVEVLDGLVGELGARSFDAQIATCLYGVFDPYTRELVLASAGHPPPVARTAAGGVNRLDVEVGAPLGLGDLPREDRLRLTPGTVLALFTDGLVARRGGDVDDGLDALCRALAAGPDDLDELANAVLAELATGSADDVALVLARIPRDADSRSHTVVIPVPRERALLLSVRSQARAAMASWALVDEVVHTATVLASELVTNAVLHGAGSVELRLRLTRDRLVVEAEDGAGDLPRRRRARAEDESGRGLQLVASLADRWGARRSDHGKVVWAELDLAVPR